MITYKPTLFFIFQESKNIDITTCDKCTDTNDLVAVEVPIELNQGNIKCEPQNQTKRIKKEPKTRKRTRKTARQLKIEAEEEEGGW